MSLKCFSEVDSSCVGKTFAISEAGAKQYMNYVISTIAGAVNLVISVGAQNMDDNLIKAALALRCLLTSGFDQTFKLILAVYYALRAFRQERRWTDLLTQSVPYLCSCQKEIKGYAAQFGSNADSTN